MSLPGSAEVLASLHPGLQRRVRHELAWRELSHIQRLAIPVILGGADCVVEAPTAGGKTEAVLFPCLTRAANARGRGVQVLYLAPLRALLNNLEDRGEKTAEACGLRAFKWHGDVGQKDKVAALRDPPDLLMTTPESLEAIFLRRPGWPELFRDLLAVVIDEAHNFAAGERGGHVASLLERLEQGVPCTPQRIALSATVGNRHLLLRWLAGRREVGQWVSATAAPREDRDVRVCYFSSAAETEDTPPEERASFRCFSSLASLLPGHRSLVFVRSRSRAEGLAKAFAPDRSLAGGTQLRVRTHHSAVSKYYREEAEALIQVASEDGLHAIVTTSTLELGIDIGELDRVIQMEALASSSSFLQRLGRTGRRAGRRQFFRGLLTDLDGLPVLAATVSLGLAGTSEALLLPRRAFHLLAHQLLCLALQSFGVEPARAWEILGGAFCFSAITRSEFDRLVAHMAEADYLRDVDGKMVAGEKAEREFLHSNWRRLFAVFDSAPLYEVLHQRQPVGTLDTRFVESLEVPFYFVLGGKLWRADAVDLADRTVRATPSAEGEAPAWQSFGGPDVPYETAQEAGRLLHGTAVPAFLDEAAAQALRGLQAQASQLPWEPGALALLVLPGGRARLVTYAGDRINRTLARVLALAGAEKVSASYEEVTVKKGPTGPEALSRLLDTALEEVRRGRWSDPAVLSAALASAQRPWPFSPFARCLPPDLSAAALVEQSFDAEGLIRLLQESTAPGPPGL